MRGKSAVLLIRNGYIKTMAGAAFENGQILIQGGKIVAVGAAVDAPADVETIDAQGRLVTPGLVDAHCHIGLEDSSMGMMGKDCNESTDPVTPQVRAIDSIYPMDESLRDALEGGVTSAVTGPGSANVIGGSFAAIKLAGTRVDNMIIKSPVAMKIAFGENPKNCYGNNGKSPKTRMAVAALLRETLFKARRYMEDIDAGKNPAFDMKLEAMIPVLRGEIPLKAHAHRSDDVFTAIRIAREFGVRMTLDHCTDGAEIVQELVKEGLPTFVGPSMTFKSKAELIHKSFKTPRILHDAGVPMAIITDSPVIPLQYLSLCAGLAIKAGLEEEAAWKAITINAATLAEIGDRVGSLEVGKDADVVIWNGNPLREIGATVYRTLVDGKVVYRQ